MSTIFDGPVTMHKLPLLELFIRLRQDGLSLGMEEYYAVLKALQAGFRVASRDELSRLCCILWAKSLDEKKILVYHFNQLIPNDGTAISDSLTKDLTSVSTGSGGSTRYQVTLKMIFLIVGLWLCVTLIFVFFHTPLPVSPPIPMPTAIPTPSFDRSDSFSMIYLALLISPLLIVIVLYLLFLFILHLVDRRRYKQNARRETKLIQDLPSSPISSLQVKTTQLANLFHELEEIRLVNTKLQPDKMELSTIGAYLPVTQREIKKNWRRIRNLVRKGSPVELDVEATVSRVGRDGLLLDPVFIPRRINQTDLLLLIDQDGSMVPFQKFTKQFTDSTIRGGQLGQVRIFYFHNCPMKYLYRDKALSDAKQIDVVFDELHPFHTVAIVLSDAGAARGSINPQRYQQTLEFVKRLNHHVKCVVWLNPMPQQRWSKTTAIEIAQLVPMFEIDRHGLRNAINVLKRQQHQSTNFVV